MTDVSESLPTASAEPVVPDGMVLAQVLMDGVQHVRVLNMAKQLNIDPANLFNVALNVLEWALNEQRDGRCIAAINLKDGTYVELELDDRAPSSATLN